MTWRLQHIDRATGEPLKTVTGKSGDALKVKARQWYKIGADPCFRIFDPGGAEWMTCRRVMGGNRLQWLWGRL